MKNFISKILACVTLSFLIISCTSSDTLNSSIEKISNLGESKFTKESWATANQEERGEMITDFLKHVEFIGKSKNEIVEILGKPTAYYDYDEFPAYVFGPKSVSSEYADGYIIAFITDSSSGKVVEYEIIP